MLKKLAVSSIALFSASALHAVLIVGTPSPALSPLFGTLINFDDKPTGTPILAGDYVAQGIASITETTGAGAAFARYGGTQSSPNYIGTGVGYEIGGASSGWDGNIRIDLSSPASKIGIGVADSRGGPETLTVYDSSGAVLESHVLPTGTNSYFVIDTGIANIARVTLSGDFFAADDFQHNSGKVPDGGSTLVLLGFAAVCLRFLRRFV